jgi:HSP20 family molecular chaperone IbpA
MPEFEGEDVRVEIENEKVLMVSGEKQREAKRRTCGLRGCGR